MLFTHRALASVWLVVLGMFALSASGTIVGKNVLWLVFGGLVTPAIVSMLAAKPWRRAITTAPFDARTPEASDVRHVIRMDIDKG